MKGTVLVVEDNLMNLEIACEVLEDAGFKTLKAMNADTGLALAASGHPDVILMDLYLPDRDGFQTASLLKNSHDPQVRNIPVIAFTAQAMEDEKRRALESGCSGVISKPIDINDFAEQVAHYMTPAESVGAEAEQVAQAPVKLDGRSFAKLIHDMKTPIHAEYAALQILLSEKHGPLSPAQRELLEEMMEANRDTLGMIQALAEKLIAEGQTNTNLIR